MTEQSPITPERLAEMKGRADAATQGEWKHGLDDADAIWADPTPDDGGNVVCEPPSGGMDASMARWPANAAHIASASPANVLALIAALEAAMAERDEAKAYTEQLDKSWYEIAEQRLNERHSMRLRAEAAEAQSTRLQAELAEAREGLKPFAAFRLEGFDCEVFEVVPSSPSNPARRIEPMWATHFRRARAIIEKEEK